MKTVLRKTGWLLVLMACACEQAGTSPGYIAGQQSLVYGDDDRSEAAAPSSSSVVAILPRSSLRYFVDAGPAPSFEDVYGLCAGERFASQPALAQCTGILIAPDLIVTAAHCLDPVASCRDYIYARGYFAADAGLPSIATLATLECDSVLLAVNTSSFDDHDLDFAVLRLAKPVEGFVAPRVRLELPVVGEPVVTIGTSGGLPFKSTSGIVLGVRNEQGDYFDFTGDLFAGGSGSGVFDAEGSLLGIHVRGGTDFELGDDGCRRARRVAEDGDESEQANTMSSVVEALCELEPELAVCVSTRGGEDAAAPSTTPSPGPLGESDGSSSPLDGVSIITEPALAPPLPSPTSPALAATPEASPEPAYDSARAVHRGGCALGGMKTPADRWALLAALACLARRGGKGSRFSGRGTGSAPFGGESPPRRASFRVSGVMSTKRAQPTSEGGAGHRPGAPMR